MKKTITLFAISIYANLAIAASPQVLATVLNSQEISNVQDIDKVEVTATYKCPNCFDIQIIGRNMFGEAYVKVRTEQDMGGQINVKFIEGSK